MKKPPCDRRLVFTAWDYLVCRFYLSGPLGARRIESADPGDTQELVRAHPVGVTPAGCARLIRLLA